MNTDIKKLVSGYKTLRSSVFIAMLFGLPFLCAIASAIVFFGGKVTADGDPDTYWVHSSASDSTTVTYDEETQTYDANGIIHYDVMLTGVTDTMGIEIPIFAGKLMFDASSKAILSYNNYIVYKGWIFPPRVRVSVQQLALLDGESAPEMYYKLVRESIGDTKSFVGSASIKNKSHQKKLINTSIYETFDLACIQKPSRSGPLCGSKMQLFIDAMPGYDLVSDKQFDEIADTIQKTGYKIQFCDAFVRYLYAAPRDIAAARMAAPTIKSIQARCDAKHQNAYKRLVAFASIIVDYNAGAVTSVYNDTFPLYQLVSAQALTVSNELWYRDYFVLLSRLIQQGTLTKEMATNSYMHYVYEIQKYADERGIPKDRIRFADASKLKALIPSEKADKLARAEQYISTEPVARSGRAVVEDALANVPAIVSSTIESAAGETYTIKLAISDRDGNPIDATMTVAVRTDQVEVRRMSIDKGTFDEHLLGWIAERESYDLDVSTVIDYVSNNYAVFRRANGSESRYCTSVVAVYKRIPGSVGHTCTTIDGAQKVHMKIGGAKPMALTVTSVADIVTAVRVTDSSLDEKLQGYVGTTTSVNAFADVATALLTQKKTETSSTTIHRQDVQAIQTIFTSYMRTDDVRVLSQHESGEDIFVLERVMGGRLTFRGSIDLGRNNRLYNISYVASKQTIPIDMTFFLIGKNMPVLRTFVADPLGYIKEQDATAWFRIQRTL